LQSSRSRAPRQVGCEIFGEAGLGADFEILKLMLETMRLAGIEDVHIDLGHVGIYRTIAARLGLQGDEEAALFAILQRKSQPDLAEFAAARRLPAAAQATLTALLDLNGDAGVLRRARERLDCSDATIAEALTALEQAVAELQQAEPRVPLHVDLAELRGYRYQTGLVFAAFAPGHGRELARGGRYNGVGREFGNPRPATGFSADLNELLRLGKSS
jgi:ATP phosphoribosyltransferase regulatory subunit